MRFVLPTEVDAGIDTCLLFGWGDAVIARWAHAGFRKPVQHGERREPITIAGAGTSPDDTVLQIKNVVPRSAR
jgi:hypothetical protein